MRIETTTFRGPFAIHIQNYLKEKAIVGYQITSFVYTLKSFDTFSKNYNSNLEYLTKDLINNWLQPRTNEKLNNVAFRASKIRLFSKYMYLQDKKSYVLPNGIYGSTEKYNAYIFSHEQIKKFFSKVDEYAQNKPNSYTHTCLQIIFRLLYMCGLRISETLNIKLKDFNEEKRIITIYKAKNDKDRIIAINDELANLIKHLINKFHIYSNKNTYLFNHKKNKPYSRFSIYYQFRIFLDRCGIEHTGDGPRLHDFRHTFCVHCLKKWTLKDKDLMTYLPILKTYLGHETFRETAYYLKLTADVFPNITEKVEEIYNNLIPSLEVENEF